MKQHGRRWIGLWVIVLVVAGGLIGIPRDQAQSAERPPYGPVIISPDMGNWHDFQRPIFRSSDFNLAKVHLPPGYSTGPEHVINLIEDGAEVIMFKTEDCAWDGYKTYRHLVERGFLEVVQQWPEVEFVIQVGNEPERCILLSMGEYVDKLAQVVLEVRPLLDQPNLRWVAGLPMDPETAKELLEEEWMIDGYDGVGTNMLGHYSLVDEYHGWHEIVDYVLEETETELWITEIGINHPPMDKALKAERILDYIDQLPTERVGGVAIFTLGEGTNWPQYEVTEAMVPVFAGLDDCRFFAPTDQFLCGPYKQFWERHGGLPIFGYPITSEERGGQGETVQFMERARFEWHPDVWPEEFDILLGHLGREMARGRENEPPFRPVSSASAPGDTCVYFSATRQNLCDEFLEYWNEFGGLPVFGYPISREFTENGFKVQYFERTRFEHQPGVWPERFDVLQGLLGAQAMDGTLQPDTAE